MFAQMLDKCSTLPSQGKQQSQPKHNFTSGRASTNSVNKNDAKPYKSSQSEVANYYPMTDEDGPMMSSDGGRAFDYEQT